MPDPLPSSLVDWAVSEGLDTVVTPYAPVGPVAERLAASRSALAERGIDLVTLRRRWDGDTWPHASRGFFPFRERIPELVREL